jgi:hypothetical protein
MNEETTAPLGYCDLFYKAILLYNYLIDNSAEEKETDILQEHLDFYWGKMTQSQRDDFNYKLKKRK